MADDGGLWSIRQVVLAVASTGGAPFNASPPSNSRRCGFSSRVVNSSPLVSTVIHQSGHTDVYMMHYIFLLGLWSDCCSFLSIVRRFAGS